MLPFVVPLAHAGDGAWIPITESGASYLTRSLEHDFGWFWTGDLGLLRRVGSDDAIGAVFMSSSNADDYTTSLGLRWDHEISSRWIVVLSPGILFHEALENPHDPRQDYFAEMGVSYRRYVTVAARLEVVRSRDQSMDEGPWPYPPVEYATHAWHIDARLGRVPGLLGLGGAALVLAATGLANALNAR